MHGAVGPSNVRTSALRSSATVSCISIFQPPEYDVTDCPCELPPRVHHVAKACLYHCCFSSSHFLRGCVSTSASMSSGQSVFSTLPIYVSAGFFILTRIVAEASSDTRVYKRLLLQRSMRIGLDACALGCCTRGPLSTIFTMPVFILQGPWPNLHCLLYYDSVRRFPNT